MSRARLLPATAAVIAALILAGCAPAETARPNLDPVATPTPAETPPAPDPVRVLGIGREPVRVAIPDLGLDEPLIGLGIRDDGKLEVPAGADDVGWFVGGGRPGGRGPTVIAAHVALSSGPAIFARLGELAIGDEVSVTDVAGTTFVYRVSEVAVYPKAALPTTDVFGVTPGDVLRLVTCDGGIDPATGRYADNLVVTALPIAEDAAP